MELYHRDTLEELATTAHFAAPVRSSTMAKPSAVTGFMILSMIAGIAAMAVSLVVGAGILVALAAYTVVGMVSFLVAVALRLFCCAVRPAPLNAGQSLDAGSRHAAWYRAARRRPDIRFGAAARSPVSPGGLPMDWTQESISRPVPLSPQLPPRSARRFSGSGGNGVPGSFRQRSFQTHRS